MSERLFKLFRPADPYPQRKGLLILLHGLGSNEEDLFSFSSTIDSGFAVASVRAPYSYSMGGYAWFSIEWTATSLIRDIAQGRSSLQKLSNEVKLLAEELGVSADRVVLGGFSQGAIMSLTLLLNYPELVGGALLMSGAVFPELVPTTRPIEGKAVLAQHGLYDPVLSIELGRGVRDTLEKFAFDAEYLEYPMAHEVSLESLRDAQAWLKAFLDAEGDGVV